MRGQVDDNICVKRNGLAGKERGDKAAPYLSCGTMAQEDSCSNARNGGHCICRDWNQGQVGKKREGKILINFLSSRQDGAVHRSRQLSGVGRSVMDCGKHRRGEEEVQEGEGFGGLLLRVTPPGEGGKEQQGGLCAGRIGERQHTKRNSGGKTRRKPRQILKKILGSCCGREKRRSALRRDKRRKVEDWECTWKDGRSVFQQ